MYNISLRNLLENQSQRFVWKSSMAHRELCALKGKQETDCQNYIRVFSRVDDHKVLVCGTNSYKPMCRQYKIGNGSPTTTPTAHDNETTEPETILIVTNDTIADPVSSTTESENLVKSEIVPEESTSDGPYELINEIDGQGRCPYSPTHNSSYIFTGNL